MVPVVVKVSVGYVMGGVFFFERVFDFLRGKIYLAVEKKCFVVYPSHMVVLITLMAKWVREFPLDFEPKITIFRN